MTYTDLTIHTRLALNSLGRDAHIKLPRDKAALADMLALLRIEQREVGGILKVANETVRA